MAKNVLGGIDYQTYHTSFHLWLTLPNGINSSVVSKTLGEKNIMIPSGTDFETVNTGIGENHIRVALAAERNPDRLEQALFSLKDILVNG